MGIFLHTCVAPVRVIDSLWRMNVSVSRHSINNAISSLAAESTKHIRAIGRTLECAYVLDNFDVQIRHKVSTVEQPDSALYHLISGSLIKMVHCSREDLKWSSYLWQRCRYNDKRTIIVPSPSIVPLFSIHPDKTDPKLLDRRERFNSWKFAIDLCTHGPEFFRQYISQLRDPEDIEKIPITKTHQVPAKSMQFSNSTVDGNIDAIADLLRQGGVLDPADLECWRAYIHRKWPNCDTLQKYANREPSLDEILSISRRLASEYSSSALKIEDFQELDLKDRDLQHENMLIRIDYLLLYEELAYAIRCGDVGRIETCLCRWIPIFKGTGKHKYASMLLEFLHDVHFVYPPPLKKPFDITGYAIQRGSQWASAESIGS